MSDLAEGDFSSGRKLTLYEQCEAFAALQEKARGARKWRTATIAHAFGVSQWSVLQLNRCLTSMSEPRYYQKVASEYRDLGHAEFMRRYYTEDTLNKLILARSRTPKRMLK